MIIDTFISPRNKLPLRNKYIYETNKGGSISVALYYVSINKFSIIIRALNDVANVVSLKIYDIDEKRFHQLNFVKEQFNNESEYNTEYQLYSVDIDEVQIIPKCIIQTSTSTNIDDIYCYNSMMSFIDLNPEYSYKFFDDKGCRNFIKMNFHSNILSAYDKLIPGAYQADLFRYCYLYVEGGCYFDNKSSLLYPIRKWIDKDSEIMLCKDLPTNIEKTNEQIEGIYNGIMLVNKRNTYILELIKEVVRRIRINAYGRSFLDITGPNVVYDCCREIKTTIYLENNKDIKVGNLKIINRVYDGYYTNYTKIYNKEHYATLWNESRVFYKERNEIENIVILVLPNEYNDKFIFSLQGNQLTIKRSFNQGWGQNLIIKVINNNTSEVSYINVGNSNNQSKVITLSENILENVSSSITSQDQNNIKKIIIRNLEKEKPNNETIMNDIITQIKEQIEQQIITTVKSYFTIEIQKNIKDILDDYIKTTINKEIKNYINEQVDKYINDNIESLKLENKMYIDNIIANNIKSI